MTKRTDAKDRRIAAADLAVQAGASIADMAELLASCIFFEQWIELGGDEVQKRMKLMPEETATVHVIEGGKAHKGSRP